MVRALTLALAIAAPLAEAGGAVAVVGVPAPTPHPIHVMSMNACTDQLVLALLPPQRIASVTWMARDPDLSQMAAAARRVAINYGSSEEVVRQRPDLIVTGSYSTPAARGLLTRLGYPLIALDEAASFADIRRITRRLAAALDERARGEALIAHMDRTLATLARDPGPGLRVAAWDGAGFNASRGSLYNAMLEVAGAINVANKPPATNYGRPDVEVLLRSAPTLLVEGARVDRKPGLRDNVGRSPVIRRYWNGARTLTIRQADYLCGTPFAADAAARLRAELRRAAAQVRGPLPFAPRGAS